MKKWIVLFSVVTAMQAVATPVLQQNVVKRAMAWMHQHPVMGPAGRSVASVEVFPDSGQRFVYVVRLSPKGYLILNPDDWASMLTSYAVFGANPPEAEEAVAELMLELGIAAEADYEAKITTESTWTLGDRLGEYFFFEPIEYHAWQADLTASMDHDLRAGFPCIVSIPGHAVVADGLMVDRGVTTYHINFGWGGANNGWWTVDNVAGSPIEDGITSLRPRLMAVPQIPVVYSDLDEPVELRWILPKRRENDVVQLNINRLEQRAGAWQSNASDITAGATSGWDVVSEGHSGDSWFAGPNGPAWMTLDEVFVPTVSSDLTFWLSRRLGTATFSVEVLADNGRSRTEIYSDNDHYSLAWEQMTLSLAAFAGQSVNLRFALSYGSYYEDTGGVWLDEPAVTSGDWFSWQFVDSISTEEVTHPELEGQPVYVTTLTDLPVGTHTLAATLVDANDVEHGVAPSLTLTVSDTQDNG